MLNDVLDREQDFFDSRNKDISKSPNFGYFRQNSPGFSRLEKKKKKKTGFSRLHKQSDKKVEKVTFFQMGWSMVQLVKDIQIFHVFI